jgi:hypothetical protein
MYTFITGVLILWKYLFWKRFGGESGLFWLGCGVVVQ